MNTRRSFFKRLAVIAAVVALAPEIAFGRVIKPTEECLVWGETVRLYRCVSEQYVKIMENAMLAAGIAAGTAPTEEQKAFVETFFYGKTRRPES